MSPSDPPTYLGEMDALLRERGPDRVLEHAHAPSPGVREAAAFGAAFARGQLSAPVEAGTKDPSLRALRLCHGASVRTQAGLAAIGELEHLVRTWPDLPLPRLALAIACTEIPGREAEAVEHAARVAADHPRSAFARLVLAYCLAHAKRHHEVLRVLEELPRDVRGTWPLASRLELASAVCARDLPRAAAAYAARNAAEGRRAYPRLARAWLSWLRCSGLVILAVLGVSLGLATGLAEELVGVRRLLTVLLVVGHLTYGWLAVHVLHRRREMLIAVLFAAGWVLVGWPW